MQGIVEKCNMKLFMDQCTHGKFKFIKSDAYLRIRGPHEAGVKAYIISGLIDSGLDIHGLESGTYNRDEQ